MPKSCPPAFRPRRWRPYPPTRSEVCAHHDRYATVDGYGTWAYRSPFSRDAVVVHTQAPGNPRGDSPGPLLWRFAYGGGWTDAPLPAGLYRPLSARLLVAVRWPVGGNTPP